ncbi:MAG: hypothetical protein KIT33_01375 [Candidatus Kapabacteria bacterium]|nr:hypothetical protein [Candidatus Kapabacteria bacterium]
MYSLVFDYAQTDKTYHNNIPVSHRASRVTLSEVEVYSLVFDSTQTDNTFLYDIHYSCWAILV